MASIIGKRVQDRDEATELGIPLAIGVNRQRKLNGFTLGYFDGVDTFERNRIYSPCLTFPEALYLLSNARNSGILTLDPTEALLCYAGSLNSSNPGRSKRYIDKIWSTRGETSGKPLSPAKPGKQPASSPALALSDSKPS